MDLEPKLKERLLKLVELSQRGVGGEKVAAETMLDKLLAANGLTKEHIARFIGNKERVLFKWKSGHFKNKALLKQVLLRVLGKGVCYYTPRKGTGMFVDVTREEEIEIKVMYSVYQAEIERQANTLWVAFINVNDIFPPDTETASKPAENQDEIQRMMRGMKPIEVNKQIG